MAIDPSNGTRHSPDNTNMIKAMPSVPQGNALTSEAFTQTVQNNTKNVLSLSSKQGEFDHLINAIQQAPDIREEKVKKIKDALESGNYHISSENIADRIIQETITDRTRTLR
ncbi:MAG: hypothetical protein NPIRA02_22610 [Nitrospirales bacterium]|nr:MAG: hypothetical protein NPIRA02_22610 [Nitrospirales bacterium]